MVPDGPAVVIANAKPLSLPVNTGINIVAASAFTNTGSSAATAQLYVTYKKIATGL